MDNYILCMLFELPGFGLKHFQFKNYESKNVHICFTLILTAATLSWYL